jgi:uncharacterized protein (TIGR02588 family)
MTMNSDDSHERTTEHKPPYDNRKWSPAERISLGFSTLIVAGLVGVIIWLYLTGGAPVVIVHVEFDTDSIREEAPGYYLPVRVTNQGGATAQALTVEIIHIRTDGSEETSTITFPFVHSHGSETATVVFDEDPREGVLRSNVVSYLTP